MLKEISIDTLKAWGKPAVLIKLQKLYDYRAFLIQQFGAGSVDASTQQDRMATVNTEIAKVEKELGRRGVSIPSTTQPSTPSQQAEKEVGEKVRIPPIDVTGPIDELKDALKMAKSATESHPTSPADLQKAEQKAAVVLGKSPIGSGFPAGAEVASKFAGPASNEMGQGLVQLDDTFIAEAPQWQEWIKKNYISPTMSDSEIKDKKKNLDEMTNFVLENAKKYGMLGAKQRIKLWINFLDGEDMYPATNLTPLEDDPKLVGTDKDNPHLGMGLLGMLSKLLRDEIKKAIVRDSSTRGEHWKRVWKVYCEAKDLGQSEEFFKHFSDLKFDDRRTLLSIAWSGYQTDMPLLLAGEPGTGKTEFGKHMCRAIDPEWDRRTSRYGGAYNRVNIHAGIEPGDLIGRWDYPRQLLALETMKVKLTNQMRVLLKDEQEKANASANPKAYLMASKSDFDKQMQALQSETMQDIFDISYFKPGPLALAMFQGSPILIDEVNRSSSDVQNLLLQAIDEKEIYIPFLKKIRASPGFYPIMTVNEDDVGIEPLGKAFKRRVKYYRFGDVRGETLVDIITANQPYIPMHVADEVATIIMIIRGDYELESEISPPVATNWALSLVNAFGPEMIKSSGIGYNTAKRKYEPAMTKEIFLATLGDLVKSQADYQTLQDNAGKILEKFQGVMDNPAEKKKFLTGKGAAPVAGMM
jgi:MoxR-like ATPase